MEATKRPTFLDAKLQKVIEIMISNIKKAEARYLLASGALKFTDTHLSAVIKFMMSKQKS